MERLLFDPAAGPQTLSIGISGPVECPPTYVCSGSYQRGYADIQGAPNTEVTLDISGSTATLSDGAGHTIIFDPVLVAGAETASYTLRADGTISPYVVGSIYLTGNEVAGTYSSLNPGGTGYTVTVNY